MTCPLCGSNNIRVIQRFNVSRLVEDWKNRFGLDVREEFSGIEEFELWECAKCRLLHFTPAQLAGSAEFYVRLERLSWYYNMPRKWEHDVALQDLRGSSKVLEVGCGVGDFVAMARNEAGLAIEGIEVNEAAVSRAQQQGLPVHLANLMEMAKREIGEYDALCNFQVLEHVPDPGEFLQACCDLLRSGGKLVFGVPDAESYIQHDWNLLDMPPHHMSRWSGEVLSRIQKLFPLRLLHVKREPLAEYHIEGYVDTYLAIYERYGLPKRIRHSRIRNWIVASLKRSGVYRLLRGQTLYAFYEKV